MCIFLETIECNNKEIRRFEYTDNKLTKVIENDKIINIEYDRYGNIIKLGNSNIKYNKRLLMESYDDITYEYNYQGIRTKKTKANEYEIKYYLDQDKIIEEEKRNLKTNEITRLIYYYEARGIRGISYKKNEEERYYSLIRDPLNNISKVINKGKIVGEYKYNAWGEIEVEIKEISDEVDRYVINNNPFRYKGYYYDVDTSLYYCINRYYSKELCRFISPDDVEYLDPESVNGLNLYCYCYNNLINYVDSSGCYPVRIQVVRLTIYFHPPHGNGPNAQRHIHIKNGNVKIASRNYDGSVHDKKYGKNYVPSKEVYNALLEHGWDWYGNKFSLIDFNGFYREEFPLQQSGYSLEQFPVTNVGSSLEVFPSLNNGFELETFPQVSLDIPYYKPFPLTNQEKQILVTTVIVVAVVVVAIALIPATGGGSAVLLFA